MRKTATEGFASRVSGTVRPLLLTRLMNTDDISAMTELLRGGGGGGSSGSLHNLGGVGRGDQGWGHFTTGVSMWRS